MSTDTDVDPVEPWEDLQDSELDELMRIIRVVGRMKDSDPTFHAFMTGSIAAHVQTINRALGKLIKAQTKEGIRRDLLKLVVKYRGRQA